MLKLIFIVTYLLSFSLLFSQDKEAEFKLCQEVETYPYYNNKVAYKGGFWIIKQHYISNYPTKTFQKLKNNSGIITIQFKVNCKGQAGEFIIKQCDLNYKPIVLDKEISTHFLKETKNLKNWIPGKDEDGNNVNSYKFFSFKMKDGILLEILPK